MDLLTMTLGEVLQKADTLDWQHSLYLPFDEAWTAETTCVILDTENYHCPDDESSIARELGFEYVFGIATVQDIVVNARLQIPDAEMSELLKAFFLLRQRCLYRLSCLLRQHKQNGFYRGWLG